MRMKKRGLEPSYAGALARAPAALRNPTTGEPFNKKTVYDRVFKTHCHDGDAILRRRFGSAPGGLPRVVYTDKGKGFYRRGVDGAWPLVRAWKAEVCMCFLSAIPYLILIHRTTH